MKVPAPIRDLEVLDTLEDALKCLGWDHVFMLPAWLHAWWEAFGAGSTIYIRPVYAGDELVGIAPMRLDGDRALFIGDPDVCDYMDFIVMPGRTEDFLDGLLRHLRADGIKHLELDNLRLKSTAMALAARSGTGEVKGSSMVCDVSVQIQLPAGWDAYLKSLNSRVAHEIKRKMRRLQEAGPIDYRVVENEVDLPGALDVLINLMCRSREDKAAFMDEHRERFFRSLTEKMGEPGLVKFGLLEMDGRNVAAVMYFDYGQTTYLYNCGYDPAYGALSVGLVSKLCCIRQSIEGGKKVFDLLKGGESYKYRLGGKEMPLYSARIDL